MEVRGKGGEEEGREVGGEGVKGVYLTESPQPAPW